jgi:hypothetical protein
MTDVIAVAIVTAVPPTILAIATLVAIIRNNYKMSTLHELVDGKFSEMLAAMTTAAKIEGKVDALHSEANRTTTVITDRRKDVS